MPKHVKTESKKEPEPQVPLRKQSEHEKQLVQTFNEVSVPVSELRQLKSNHEKENQSSEKKDSH